MQTCPAVVTVSQVSVICRVIFFLKNLEMLGNLAAVREISGGKLLSGKLSIDYLKFGAMSVFIGLFWLYTAV